LNKLLVEDKFMIITFGCECTGGMCGCYPGNNHPCIERVIRDGRAMNLCSRCTLEGDETIAYLYDKNTESEIFMNYDILGAFCMLGNLAHGTRDIQES
jgi:hypothetical protein